LEIRKAKPKIHLGKKSSRQTLKKTDQEEIGGRQVDNVVRRKGVCANKGDKQGRGGLRSRYGNTRQKETCGVGFRGQKELTILVRQKGMT